MLSLKTWEPTTYDVGGHPITFEIKRLGFTESKPFNVAFGKIRIDAPIAARSKMERASSALTEKGLAAAAGALVAAGATPPPRTADLDADIKAHNDALAAAGVRMPDLPADVERELYVDLSAAAREVAEADALLDASLDDAFVARCFRDYLRNVQGLEIDGVAVDTGEALHAHADRHLVLFVLRKIRSFSHLGEAEKNGSSSPSPSAPGAEAEGGALTAAPVESAALPTSAIATATRPEQTSYSEPAEAVAPV